MKFVAAMLDGGSSDGGGCQDAGENNQQPPPCDAQCLRGRRRGSPFSGEGELGIIPESVGALCRMVGGGEPRMDWGGGEVREWDQSAMKKEQVVASASTWSMLTISMHLGGRREGRKDVAGT